MSLAQQEPAAAFLAVRTTQATGQKSVNRVPTGVKLRQPKLEPTFLWRLRQVPKAFSLQLKRTIHNNVELVIGDKSSYLTLLLKGESRETIAELQQTEECYKDAIHIL